MKNLNLLIILLLTVSISACVTTKKFNRLDQSYKSLQKDKANCGQQLLDAQALNDKLNEKTNSLQAMVDDLKKQLDNSNHSTSQILNTLQDMSVLSNKQAESVKQ